MLSLMGCAVVRVQPHQQLVPGHHSTTTNKPEMARRARHVISVSSKTAPEADANRSKSSVDGVAINGVSDACKKSPQPASAKQCSSNSQEDGAKVTTCSLQSRDPLEQVEQLTWLIAITQPIVICRSGRTPKSDNAR